MACIFPATSLNALPTCALNVPAPCFTSAYPPCNPAKLPSNLLSVPERARQPSAALRHLQHDGI
eukprot:7473128-Lingulodinium_polyedra.AAC.1